MIRIRLQKVAYCAAKGRLLPCERLPLATQKVTFCIPPVSCLPRALCPQAFRPFIRACLVSIVTHPAAVVAKM